MKEKVEKKIQECSGKATYMIFTIVKMLTLISKYTNNVIVN